MSPTTWVTALKRKSHHVNGITSQNESKKVERTIDKHFLHGPQSVLQDHTDVTMSTH